MGSLKLKKQRTMLSTTPSVQLSAGGRLSFVQTVVNAESRAVTTVRKEGSSRAPCLPATEATFIAQGPPCGSATCLGAWIMKALLQSSLDASRRKFALVMMDALGAGARSDTGLERLLWPQCRRSKKQWLTDARC